MTNGTGITNSTWPRNIFEAGWRDIKTALAALRVKGRQWGEQAGACVRVTAAKENNHEQHA